MGRWPGFGSWTVRGLGRAVGPWVDLKTRRPLVALVAVVLVVFLGPLAPDVARAWYGSWPRWLRWGIGEGAFLAVVGVGARRLWQVRPGDEWPGRWVPDGSASGRWVPWALRLAVASLAIPLVRHPEGNLGFADWDFVLDKFEAVRRTILEWGQFPWWHPWCRGGFPLAAEPQIGAVSMATPLILAFGTTTGLGLSTALCLLIAVEGAYRLSLHWTREPWSAAASALIYGLNGAVVINTAWGYVLPMSYGCLPWLAIHAFRIGDRPSDGLALGFWAAFAVMNGIQYATLYAVLLAAAIGLRAWRVQPAGLRGRLLLHAMAAVGLALALCGTRLATVLDVMKDDSRQRISYWDESPLAALHHLVSRPPGDWPEVVPLPFLAQYIETTSYVGLAVVLLALASLARGWRWWHALTLVAGWLALGSLRWYQPSYWLADWPLFASTHVVTRWRFVALLGLGLAAGSVIAAWRRSNSRAVRALAILTALFIAADLLALAHRQLPLAFGVPPGPDSYPGPPVPGIVNVRDGVGYPCARRGYGVIRGYEPMVGGYRRDAPTLRKAREDPDYRGESWTVDGPIEPTSWSPNRITFRARPGQEIFINQNPGSWWTLNGRPAFPGRRVAEPLQPFAVRADAEGRVDLRIRPRGLGLGIALHAAGLALLAAAWSASRMPRGGGPAPSTPRPTGLGPGREGAAGITTRPEAGGTVGHARPIARHEGPGDARAP